jgi:uncharacterized protein
MTSAWLPMFPLGTVLVPGGLLPLHVFEPRYRALMRDCLAGDARFGVVLIERGSEVGGNDQRFGVGTVARIRDAAELADGRWVLVAEGTERIRIARWLPDAPYPRAEVEAIAEAPWREGARPALEAATAGVRRAVAYASELGEASITATLELPEDPVAAAWYLTGVAPIGPVDRQRLLETHDHGARLDALAGLARDAAMILEYRLGGPELG